MFGTLQLSFRLIFLGLLMWPSLKPFEAVIIFITAWVWSFLFFQSLSSHLHVSFCMHLLLRRVLVCWCLLQIFYATSTFFGSGRSHSGLETDPYKVWLSIFNYLVMIPRLRRVCLFYCDYYTMMPNLIQNAKKILCPTNPSILKAENPV